MSDLNEILLSYAKESGEIETVDEYPDIDIDDVMIDEYYYPDEGGVSELIDQADQSESIADHLEDVADRADALATDEQEYSRNAVSVESLHREFNTIMRANKLTFKATSFECEVTDMGRLQGLSKDARRTATMIRNYRSEILDYSQEGAIVQFFRRDKARLEKATAALNSAEAHFKSKSGEIKEKPIEIKHEGLARFLVINGKPVDNLKEAISHEVKYLHDGLSAVNSASDALMRALDDLKAGHGDKYKSGSLAGGFDKLDTSSTGLLGNFTVEKEDSDGSNYKGLFVPELTRYSLHKDDMGKLAKAQLKGFLYTLPIFVIGGAAAGVMFVSGNIGGAAVTQAATIAGGGVIRDSIAIKDYDKRLNASDQKSLAGVSDVLSIIQLIKGLEKQLSFKMAEVDFSAKLKEARSGEKVDKDAIKAVEKAWSRLAKIVDILYEQAIYVTVMIATLVETTAKKAD